MGHPSVPMYELDLIWATRLLVDWKAQFLREEFVNRFLAAILIPAMAAFASDLPSKKYLDLASVKVMVAAAEAKAK